MRGNFSRRLPTTTAHLPPAVKTFIPPLSFFSLSSPPSSSRLHHYLAFPVETFIHHWDPPSLSSLSSLSYSTPSLYSSLLRAHHHHHHRRHHHLYNFYFYFTTENRLELFYTRSACHSISFCVTCQWSNLPEEPCRIKSSLHSKARTLERSSTALDQMYH